MEKTLILVKPDGVLRGLTGEVISRFEKVGLKLIGLKLLAPDEELGKQHYPITDEWAKTLWQKTKEKMAAQGETFNETIEELAQKVQTWLVTLLISGPVVAAVFEGPDAVKTCRKIAGFTEPLSAAPGTIRGDFSMDSYKLAMQENRTIRNIVHASGSQEEANREIKLWFKDNEFILGLKPPI